MKLNLLFTFTTIKEFASEPPGPSLCIASQVGILQRSIPARGSAARPNVQLEER